MRADRLLSLLMVLQTRGRVTAQALADELEVSERTIYRDLDALSQAGVPVYTDRGPGGGCSLLESYRSSLTGLNEPELRALLLLGVPGPLADLGLAQELKAALLKLSSARDTQPGQFRGRLYLDWSGGERASEPVPHLAELRRAVWEDRRVTLAYRTPQDYWVETEVCAYGLAARAGAWWLAGARETAGRESAMRGSAVRAYPIEALGRVSVLEEHFQRPSNFDMEIFWRDWCAREREDRPVYRVSLRAAGSLLGYLEHHFARQLAPLAPADEQGRICLDLEFESFEAARERILGLGRAVEIVEPDALRQSVADFALQTVRMYGER